MDIYIKIIEGMNYFIKTVIPTDIGISISGFTFYDFDYYLSGGHDYDQRKNIARYLQYYQNNPYKDEDQNQKSLITNFVTVTHLNEFINNLTIEEAETLSRIWTGSHRWAKNFLLDISYKATQKQNQKFNLCDININTCSQTITIYIPQTIECEKIYSHVFENVLGKMLTPDNFLVD
jgi:hypothetical protein